MPNCALLNWARVSQNWAAMEPKFDEIKDALGTDAAANIAGAHSWEAGFEDDTTDGETGFWEDRPGLGLNPRGKCAGSILRCFFLRCLLRLDLEGVAVSVRLEFSSSSSASSCSSSGEIFATGKIGFVKDNWDNRGATSKANDGEGVEAASPDEALCIVASVSNGGAVLSCK